MTTQTYISIIAIVIMIVLAQMLKGKKKTNDNNVEQYKNAYKKRYLLTLNEKNQFFKIKEVTDRLNLLLFTKVRLADIVEPKSSGNYKALFNKIQAKHVDFLICDKNCNMICAIEIDDSSHLKENRKQRDKFLNFILDDCGIPLIRKIYVQISELQREILDLI